jgi:NAD(P)-dependent dehydrogenase (short-subunit alcohol dehydrogenase family)
MTEQRTAEHGRRFEGRFDGRVAIVTGGGSGIGLAYCERLLQEGARVMVSDIGVEQGEKAVADLGGLGEIGFVRTDIADEDSAAAAVAATVDRFGTVDILINNAAIYGDYEGHNNSLEYLKKVFDVNVHGQWLMARAATPLMVRKGYGRVVNIASIAAYLHQLGAMPQDPEHFQLSSYAYGHSKFGVLGLTRMMAGQLGQYGVTVNAVAPGLVMTEATEKQVPEDFRPMFAMMSASRRNTEPRHMVGPALFLASDDAEMVNGQILVVDGGNIMPV